MICEYFGGPLDGGMETIPDDKCEIGSIHEACFTLQDEDWMPTPDFVDPVLSGAQTITITAFYRLIGISSLRGGHLKYQPLYRK